MKRREFLASSVSVAGLGTILAGANARGEDAATLTGREFYELRLYQLRRGPQTELFDRFYRDAAIPAYNRAGVDRVGVFTLAIGPGSPMMYVLLTHKSLDSIAAANDLLADDAEYQKAGADFINAPSTSPAFVRVESSVMRAFSGMPISNVPPTTTSKTARLFELRTYESHSKKANRKKIEMFNTAEIAIFHRHGLNPIFFGETLAGAHMPNLTYLLAFDSQEAHDKAWSAFGADPDWQKLRTTPGYTDVETVCNISNYFLRSTAYSQI
jgi:hypothetical protein